MFNSPKVVVVITSTWAAGTTFSNILLLSLFHFYRNLSSEYCYGLYKQDSISTKGRLISG